MRSMVTRLFLFCLVLVSVSSSAGAQEQGASPEFRATMNEVYRAYTSLQPFLHDKKAFEDSKNTAQIKALLKTLNDKFHRAEAFDAALSSDPGYTSTLKTAQEMISDAFNRFNEGNKSYARWRLKGASTYCISCHTVTR